MTKNVSPSIKETAFSCPHCGAYTTQFWYKLYAESLPEANPKPLIPSKDEKEDFASHSDDLSAEKREGIMNWFEMMFSGLVFLEYSDNYTSVVRQKFLYMAFHTMVRFECIRCKLEGSSS